MSSGIYKLTNLYNDNFYIGSAVNLDKRWSMHLTALKKGNHANSHLQHAWNKYGGQYFKFEILEICAKHALIELEQEYMNSLKPIYNICKQAKSRLGTKHSEETKFKLKKAALNRTETHLASTRTANLGRKHTEETKKIISEKIKGRISPMKGKRHNIKSINKMSEVKKGEKNNFYGKTHTEENKLRIVATRKRNKEIKQILSVWGCL